jgi:hypothetical protein
MLAGQGMASRRKIEEEGPMTTRRWTSAAAVPDADVEPPPPGIEVEYVLATSNAPSRDRVYLQIWTRNRLYHVSAAMVCVAVIDRETRKPDPTARLLGSKLSGGETIRADGSIDLYFPLPVPGCAAVFADPAKQAKVGRTSEVERVVMRLHKMRVRPGAIDTENMTGRFRAR